ncbi:MAG: CPBP family intramembrane metalloprotease [Acidobacteriota bacterium]|nr:CPBP family intramembrane metalloprotease [Acidobacteriota bacterium]
MREIYRAIEEDFAALDRRALGALVYTAFALTCIYYLGNAEKFVDLLRRTPFDGVAESLFSTDKNNLAALAYWVFIVTLFYFIVPALGVRYVLKQDLKDYGLSPKIEKGFGKLYLQCAAVMLPLVYLVSLTEGFAGKYPFLKIYDGEPYFGYALLAWELLYFLQFFGLEFFFRGFLVHSLKRALGFYSIFVMTVPYCMIHFGKPVTESFAAIFAGIFLGWLSYRNNSIWLGLLLHCTVALLMDVLALHHKGLLF